MTKRMPVLIALGALLTGAVTPVPAADTPPLPDSRSAAQPAPAPARGVFLVADASMPDPRFRGTVVLLLEHSAQGTHGVIVNRPLDATVADVIPGLAGHGGSRHALHYGGPVGLDQIVFLVRDGRPGDDELTQVIEGVSAGSAPGTLEALMPTLEPASLRVIAGYAGWAPGQLAAELRRADWHLVDATADDIFADDPEALWERLRGGAGLLVQASRFARLRVAGAAAP